MDFKAMVPTPNTMWVRCSDYFHTKSEFCGTKCRNYYNVKVFLERSKEIAKETIRAPEAVEEDA